MGRVGQDKRHGRAGKSLGVQEWEARKGRVRERRVKETREERETVHRWNRRENEKSRSRIDDER